MDCRVKGYKEFWFFIVFCIFQLFPFIIRMAQDQFLFLRMMLLENCLVEKWRDQLSKRSIVSINGNTKDMGLRACEEIL